MMKVPYRIRESGIHGLGVFAAREIKKGEVVWEYNEPQDCRVYDNENRDAFSLKYGYICKNDKGIECVELCGDGAIFINHSLSNANMDQDKEDEDRMIASKDIAFGEEFLENYYKFYEDPLSGGHLVK